MSISTAILNGSVPLETILDLGRTHGVPLPEQVARALQNAWDIAFLDASEKIRLRGGD